MYNCSGNVIKGNIIISYKYNGITCYGSGCDNIIVGNYIRQCGQHGILIGTINSVVANNICFANSQGQNLGYSNIYAYGANNTLIQGNICRAGNLTNKPAYGIHIVASTGVVVINNDCYDGGATAGIKDEGTDTCFGAGNRVKDGSWIIGGDG